MYGLNVHMHALYMTMPDHRWRWNPVCVSDNRVPFRNMIATQYEASIQHGLRNAHSCYSLAIGDLCASRTTAGTLGLSPSGQTTDLRPT